MLFLLLHMEVYLSDGEFLMASFSALHCGWYTDGLVVANMCKP